MHRSSRSSSAWRRSASTSTVATLTKSRPASAPAARPRSSGGVSVERATRELGQKLKEIAAQALEAGAGDLEISEGVVRIAGTDRSISFADLAKRPGADPSKLNASATFASADGTYPNGTHVAEVEIDPATGIIKIVNYVIVDDFGKTLNPLLLAGGCMAVPCRASAVP